ncbi:helix-turn-helix domain-containing protein [Pseudoclavibacter soli]|uniref:helix-turn-helix domain-containing protein n=1 Tax=Pseudoclavibacter soli TaxID=452623 RepID=UPI000420256C|nr:GAF domain-containing protein [Pseudoclavibacter soli]
MALDKHVHSDTPAVVGAVQLREMIGDGLPPAALSDALAMARDAGMSEDALQLAVTLNDLVLREQSRVRLLNVLQHTATDLTRIHDYEEVLRAICERTRALLGSDMAYISLNDDDAAATYIRMTSGVRTAGYRSIRMPLGTGVLGVVASGDRTAQSTDYAADRQVVHIAQIDEVVAAEGVRTILGAPLRVADQVIGALMLAERHRRIFSDDEVAMIEAIAAHAAVAVENARLFEELRAALTEAQERRHSELIDGVLSGELSETSLRRRLQAQGFSGLRGMSLAVIEVSEAEREALARRLLAAHRCATVVARHSGHLCVLMGPAAGEAHDNGLARGRRLAELLPADGHWVMGCSLLADSADELRQGHQQAITVARGLRTFGVWAAVADPCTLGSSGMLAAHGDARLLDGVIATLDPLVAYDRAHGTQLVRTATEYLDQQGAIGAAAERLHVHQNTVRARLARIDTLMGDGWMRGARAFDAHLALRLLALRDAMLPG